MWVKNNHVTTLNVTTDELKRNTKLNKHKIFFYTYEENKNKHGIKYMVTKQKE